MDTPSYIAKNHDELFDNAPPDIQDLIVNGEVDAATITLAKNYNIPVGKQTSLSNVISFILIGAILPDDVLQALQELVEVSDEDAVHIATDLEHSILEKARISLFKKNGEIKTLEFQGERTKEELRKELLDTTKRESGLQKNQASKTTTKPTTMITPGSRAQLLEQLQVISSIPNDEEIEGRLKHIQEQISAMKKEEDDNRLDSKIALKSFMFGEKGKEVVPPTATHATYSVAPTQYNIDPYKEIIVE